MDFKNESYCVLLKRNSRFVSLSVLLAVPECVVKERDLTSSLVE